MMLAQANIQLSSLIGTWRLDPERTSVHFRTRAAWLIRAKGTRQATDGTAKVGADGRVSAKIVFDAASIDTKIKKRDDHLRTGDFFDVAHYPEITFTVAELRPVPSGDLKLAGKLEVHGRSTPLTLPVELGIEGESAVLSTEVVVTKGILGMKRAIATRMM